MRPRRELPPALLSLLKEQDGAMTTAQALTAGLTHDHLRSLRRAGWEHPSHGVWVMPDAPDPVRASLRAALLVNPTGTLGGVSAARIHRLWGLPQWSSDERPKIMLPKGATYHRRTGVGRSSGLRDGEQTVIDGFRVTSLDRTVRDLATVLSPDDLVCIADSALRAGWRPPQWTGRGAARLASAVALADPRSESAFETYLRLLLVKAGLAPEALQYELTDRTGRVCARIDFAWPSVRLAVEADGQQFHDEVAALYHDRARANAVILEGWRILRFTWYDVRRRPEWVVAQVRAAISGAARVG